MRLIFFCRHAEYDQDDPHRGITKVGRGQIAELAREIARIVTIDAPGTPETVKVLASPVTRASESADLLADQLGLEAPETRQELSCEGGLDNDAVLDLIQARAAVDVLILVTHLEYCRDIPALLQYKTFGTETTMRRSIRMGGAQAISLPSGRIRLL